jgi:hypothetical protein
VWNLGVVNPVTRVVRRAPTRARLRRRLLRVSVCAVVLVTGCSLRDTGAAPTPAPRAPSASAAIGSVQVSPDKVAEVASADGALRVQLPAGAVSNDATLSLSTVTGPDGQAGWSVELNGADLIGSATLRFSVPELAAGEPAPMISFNDAAQEPTTPVASTVRGGEVVVVTDHFSNWFLDRWSDVRARLMPEILDRFDRLLSAAGEGKHPRCANEHSVRGEGYRVKSDSGRRAYWCLGRENGSLVLKVVNARGYAVAAESTPGLNLSALDDAYGLAWVANVIKAPPYKVGNKIALVSSGGAANYRLDESLLAGGHRGVTLRADSGAYLLTATQFAVETATMLLAKFGTGKTNKRVVTALKSAGCLSAFTQMATTRVSGPADAQAVLSAALTVAFDCVEVVMRDFDFGPVLEGVVGPLMWLWSGVLTAVTGVVAAADSLSEVFGVVGYTIVVSGPRPQLNLTADNTGLGPWEFGSPFGRAYNEMETWFDAPDIDTAWTRYHRIGGESGWFAQRNDVISPSWDHEYVRVACWEALCAIFGGPSPASGTFRGWELSKWHYWGDYAEVNPNEPPIVLKGSQIGLGDSWTDFSAAYPDATLGLGEGNSIVIDNPPWPGIFDGVWAWRLEGAAMNGDVSQVGPDTKIVRMSGGEGPEPGCC